MIADAVDTLITLAVFLTVVVAVAALVCGHQGQPWPLTPLWRTVRARMPRAARCAPAGAPRGASRLPLHLRDAPEALTPPSSPVPAWAHTDKDTAA